MASDKWFGFMYYMYNVAEYNPAHDRQFLF